VTLDLTIGREGEQGLHVRIDWGDGTSDHLVQARDFQPGVRFSRTHLYSPEAIQAQLQDSALGNSSGSNEFAIGIQARYGQKALEITRDTIPGEARIENTTVPRDNAGQPTQFFTSVTTPVGRTDLTQNVLTVAVSSPGINSPGLAVREFGSREVVIPQPRKSPEPVTTSTEPILNQSTLGEARTEVYSTRAPNLVIVWVRRIIDGRDEVDENKVWVVGRETMDDQTAGDLVEKLVTIDGNQIELPDLAQFATQQEILEWLRKRPDGHYQIERAEIEGDKILNKVLNKVLIEDVYLYGGEEISPDLLEPPEFSPELPSAVVPPAPSETPSEATLRESGPNPVASTASTWFAATPQWQRWPALLAQQALSRVRQEGSLPSSHVPVSPNSGSVPAGELPVSPNTTSVLLSRSESP
jgi:hypothetical protein